MQRIYRSIQACPRLSRVSDVKCWFRAMVLACLLQRGGKRHGFVQSQPWRGSVRRGTFENSGDPKNRPPTKSPSLQKGSVSVVIFGSASFM